VEFAGAGWRAERNTFRNNEARKSSLYDAYSGAFGGCDCSLVLGPGDGAISCGGK